MRAFLMSHASPRTRRAGVTMVLATAAVTALAAAPPASAQSLASRIEAAGNGAITFTYPTREGVCGNGKKSISIRSRDHDVTTDRYGSERCVEGPAVVEMTQRNGRITSLEVSVGGTREPAGRSLGTVTAADAANHMLRVAETTGDSDIGGRAVFAATIADAPQQDVASGMLALARRSSVHTETRKSAVFWLGQMAGDRATAGLTSILGDDSQEIEVRESAIFALSQQRTEQSLTALMDVAKSSREPKLRRSALFWLGQRSDDPRVLRLFEDILLKG